MEDFFEFEDFLDIGEAQKRPPTWRIPGHLRQPIVPDEVDFILQNLQRKHFQCRRHRLVRKFVVDNKVSKSIYETCPSPWFCLKEFICNNREDASKYTAYETNLRALVIPAVENFLLQKTNYINSTDYTSMEGLRNDIKNIILSPDLVKSYIHKRKSEYIKDLITEVEFPIGDFIQGTRKLVAEKEVFLFQCPNHGNCLGPTSLLLGALDIIQTRFALYLYWKLCDYFEKYGKKSIYKRGMNLISTIEDLQVTYGEKIFKLLKTWESYVVGRICSNSKLDTGFHELLDSATTAIEEVFVSFRSSDLPALFISNTANPDEIKMSLELTALSKGFGHPCINSTDGMDEICGLASKKLDINQQTCIETRCTFVKTFIKSYIEKNKMWPNIEFVENPNPTIMNAHAHNRWLTPREYENIHLTDWGAIKFLKTFDFDYSVDTTELLSDKSNAPRLSHWSQKYDPCGFADNGQKKPNLEPDPTRVIIRYLQGRPEETKEVIEEINTHNQDPENNICVLCRKERELKEKGRLFCEQTYRQRLAQTACENNIKKYIFPYIRQQTMSDSELGLKRKISELLKMIASGKCDVINLDLYRWNMLQRHESNYRVSQDIDDLFGFDHVYKDSHLWMQRSFVLNNSRVNPPLINLTTGLPIPGKSCHINQLGGFEGMRQKLWTISTLCALLCVSEQQQIRMNMIGQGDNVVIVVRWSLRHTHDLQRHRILLVDAIYNKISGLGLKLKTEETWVSNRLFQYGKVSYLNGTAISNGTKRAMRIISDEHDGIPTFETSLCMISTATENIANNDWNPDSAFILYSVETMSLFFRKGVLSNAHSPKDLIICLLWSSVFGGLPLSSFANHSLRGLDDKLTIWISLLRQLKKYDIGIFHKFFLITQIKIRPNVELIRIITDIYSINVVSLRTASLTAREIVKDALPLFTTNTEVLDVLTLEIESKEELIDTLSSVRPFFPPLLHELYRNSNAGLVYNIQNRLTNVQTIVKIARTHGTKDPYQVIEDTNKKLLNLLKGYFLPEHFIKEQESLKSHWMKDIIVNGRCSYELAKKVRELTWGLKIEGLTQPVPWEQIITLPLDEIPKKYKANYIHTCVSKRVFQSPQIVKNTRGPFDPYVGSNTHIKALGTLSNVVNPNPFLKSIKELYYLEAWARKEKSEDISILIKALIKEKTDHFPDLAVMDFLDNEEEVIYGGNIYHRFYSVTQSKGALANFLFGIGTFMKSSTNSLKEFSRGGDDRTIFFQMIFLYIQTVIMNIILFPSSLHASPQYGSYFPCHSCVEKVPESVFSLEEASKQVSRSSTPELPGALVGQVTYQDHLKPQYTIQDLSIALSVDCGRKCSDNIRKEYYQNLLEKSILDNPPMQDAYTNLNHVEVRTMDITYFSIGLLYTSFIIRADLDDDTGNEGLSGRDKAKIYSSVFTLLVTTGRIHQFCVMCNYSPTSYKESNIPSEGGKIIRKGLVYMLNSITFLRQLVQFTFSYILGNEEPASDLNFVRWVAKRVLIYTLISKKKDLEKIKGKKERVYMKLLHAKSNYEDRVKNLDDQQKKKNDKEKEEFGKIYNELGIQEVLVANCIDEIRELKYTLQNLKKYNLNTSSYIITTLSGSVFSSFYFGNLNRVMRRLPTEEDARVEWRRQKCPDLQSRLILPIEPLSRANTPPKKPDRLDLDYLGKTSFFMLEKSNISTYYIKKEDLIYMDNLKMDIIVRSGRTLGRINQNIGELSIIIQSFLEDLSPYFLNDTLIKENLSVCSLADGSGEVGKYIHHLTDLPLILNTLMYPEDTPHLDYTSPILPAFLGDPHIKLETSFVGGTELLIGETDITDESFARKYEKLVITGGKENILLTIDLESLSEQTYLKLVGVLPVYLNSLNIYGLAIIKTIISSEILYQYAQIEVSLRCLCFIYHPANSKQLINRTYILIVSNRGHIESSLHKTFLLKYCIPISRVRDDLISQTLCSGNRPYTLLFSNTNITMLTGSGASNPVPFSPLRDLKRIQDLGTTIFRNTPRGIIQCFFDKTIYDQLELTCENLITLLVSITTRTKDSADRAGFATSATVHKYGTLNSIEEQVNRILLLCIYKIFLSENDDIRDNMLKNMTTHRCVLRDIKEQKKLDTVWVKTLYWERVESQKESFGSIHKKILGNLLSTPIPKKPYCPKTCIHLELEYLKQKYPKLTDLQIKECITLFTRLKKLAFKIKTFQVR